MNAPLGMKEKIGFIGLGLMGAPMAHNIFRSDANLVVYNRTPAKADSLTENGAVLATSPADLAHRVGSGIIVICVSDTPSLETALSGENGVISGLAEGALVIDMGTSGVSATKRLAEAIQRAGARYIDAPVSGGEVGAKEGTLSIMVGGDERDLARAEPVFRILGKATTHVGPVGSGQAAKAANQVIVGATVAIVAEALLLAKEAGADMAAVREALSGGFAGSRILELHGQRMIDGSFAPGARASTQLKDMRQAADLAEECGLSLPLLAKARDLWVEMVASGRGELDQAGFFDFANSRARGFSRA